MWYAAWSQAQQSDPKNPAFAEGREKLRRMRYPRINRSAVLFGFAAIALLTLQSWVQYHDSVRRTEDLRVAMLAAGTRLDAARVELADRIAVGETRIRDDTQSLAGMAKNAAAADERLQGLVNGLVQTESQILQQVQRTARSDEVARLAIEVSSLAREVDHLSEIVRAAALESPDAFGRSITQSETGAAVGSHAPDQQPPAAGHNQGSIGAHPGQ